MNDRVPGAPGQKVMTITPEEFAKLQKGQASVVTLVRDDKPITPGTPYSKAAVLPDELAQKICPEVADPTPADALKHLLPTNGAFPMTGDLDMGGNRIKNLADPVSSGDAVPKKYVDPALRDYIVAEGTSGIWEYRKWNSGKAECWAKFDLTGDFDNSAGSLVFTNNVGGTAYPFTFSSRPKEFPSAVNADGQGWIVLCADYQINGVAQCGVYRACRGEKIGHALNWRFNLYVIGEWK